MADKAKTRRKSWFIICWPNGLKTSAYKSGSASDISNERKVSSKAAGKKLYNKLLEAQQIFETTGYEDPILKKPGQLNVPSSR